MESCCLQSTNREELERRPVHGGTAVVERCTVCGRKHYFLLVDPLIFGTQGVPMGKE